MSDSCFVIANVDKAHHSLSTLLDDEGRTRRYAIVSDKVGRAKFRVHLLREILDFDLVVVNEAAIRLLKSPV
jgi:hypothetical protein